MNLELCLRIIDVLCMIMQAKAELESDDDMYDILDIIFKSIITAYHKNDLYAIEEILDNAEKVLSIM